MNDLSTIWNVPDQSIQDSWAAYQNQGIAPGNVWLTNESGSWQFDIQLTPNQSETTYQIQWNNDVGGAQVDFF